MDAAIREIVMPGARGPVRVTPKAIGVLKALARQPGQVVTRDALLSEVWPETLPTDDVLTQAVTQLRKAFGSGAAGLQAGRAYIETIAKSGYRLKQPVSAEPSEHDAAGGARGGETEVPRIEAGPAVDAGAHVQAIPASVADEVPRMPTRAEPPHITRSAHSRTLVLAVAVLLVLALGLAALLAWGGVSIWSSAPRDARTSYRLITSDLGANWNPALSPDGVQVAYSAAHETGDGSRILIQPARNAPAQPLTPEAAPGVRDSDPIWSPDGRDIAFVRRDGTQGCAVLVAAVDVLGPPREALVCDGAGNVGFDWLPDGTGLVLGTLDASQADAGMQVLDLASGALRPLAYASAQGAIDQAPRVSPDGRWILFARNPQLGDLWRTPVSGGPAERLTHLNADLRGWSWAGPDAVLFGRRVDLEVRLYRLDLLTGTISDLGLDDAQAPSVSAGQEMLAFVRRQPQFGLFRLRIDSEGAIARERVFASSGRDHTPVVSPDGTQLAFGSDRAGPYELWLAGLPSPDAVPVPIEGLVLEGSRPPVWSPDGSRLLVVGVTSDPADTPTTTALFEVDVELRRAARLDLPVGPIVQGGYAKNGDLLVIAHDDRSGLDLVRLERTAPSAWRRVDVLPDVSQFRYVADEDRVLFTRLSGDGLWQVDGALRTASLRQLDAERPARRGYRSWAPTPSGEVEYLTQAAHCASRLDRLQRGDRASAPRSVCLSEDRYAAGNGFSVDPATGAIYLSMTVEDGAEIGVAAVPQGAPTHVESVIRIVRRLIFMGKWTS